MRQHLLDGEKMIYKAFLHWIIFIKPAFFFVIGLVLLTFGNHILPKVLLNNIPAELAAFTFYSLDVIRLTGAGVILLIALPLYLPPFIEKITSEFWVSNKRVLIKKGLIKRNSFEIMLKKVEGIGVDQPIMGRLFNFGTIIITGTGSAREKFHKIQGPLEFRRQIQQQIDLI